MEPSGDAKGSYATYGLLSWELDVWGKLRAQRAAAFESYQAVGLEYAFARQSLAATVAERPVPIQPRTLIAENKWRAARHGLDAELVDLRRDRPRPAREAVRELVELAAPAASALGCVVELDEIEGLLERGSGADEQRLAHGADGSLLSVARWLAEETVGDAGRSTH